MLSPPKPVELLGWLRIQPIEFGWNCWGGWVGVGEAVIPKAPFDRLGIGEGKATPATPTFVKKGNSLGAKKVWMGDGVEDEVEHLGEWGVGDEIFCGLVGHGVLEDGPRKNHALFLVTQEGNVDKENGETDLAVFFVPGLLHMHCDVLFGGRVEEGEDCTTCEEEAWEGEGVDVGTYHRWLVYNVKIRHILEDKKLNPVFFQFIFGPKFPGENKECIRIKPRGFPSWLGPAWAGWGSGLGWGWIGLTRPGWT